LVEWQEQHPVEKGVSQIPITSVIEQSEEEEPDLIHLGRGHKMAIVVVIIYLCNY